MKQGDLVRCIQQPGVSHDSHLGYTKPMKYVIKGRFGFLVSERNKGVWFIYFPQINYVHPLAESAFELISESG